MIRVGVVGLGHNGLAHIEAHRRVGLSEITAVCDSNPDRLECCARQFGIARAYASAEDLCADAAVDAVSINTGDPYHGKPFAAAVRHGKHVLLEKPVANALGELEAMVEAAAAGSRLKLAVGYILRFNPVFEKIHALCSANRLGRVYYLEADYIHNLTYQAAQTDSRTRANWFLDEERPLVGGGSHPLDLLRWFAGAEIVEAAGYSVAAAFPRMKEHDCQVALFRFDNGSIGKVAALYAPRTERPPYYNLRVYGTRGTIERDQAALANDENDMHPRFVPIDADRVRGHPYDPEIEDWLLAIRDDRQPRCTFLDGANSTAATLTAVEAMAQGKALPVKVYR